MYQAMSGEKGSSSALHRLKCSRFVLDSARNIDIHQLCSVNSQALKQQQRDEHCQGHPTSIKELLSTNKWRSAFKFNSSKDQFWYPMKPERPPSNYSPGLLAILAEALRKLCDKDNIDQAVLCYERTPHISREVLDDCWSCGYRNFTMACAALMDQQIQPLYFSYLNASPPPGVRNLQQWVENAWEQGYDATGAKQLGSTLVGTKKRIGTCEIYIALSSRGIPCELVDFDLTQSTEEFDALIQWFMSYFLGPMKEHGTVNDVLCNASPVIATDKMPVILQWDGHSVTIVGYELSKSKGVNLLQFDPSRRIHKSHKKLRKAGLTGLQSVAWGSSPRLPRALLARHRESCTSEDPIDISDSSGNAVEPDKKIPLNPEEVVELFRLDMSKLRNRKEVQLLYFPMIEPLTNDERERYTSSLESVNDIVPLKN